MSYRHLDWVPHAWLASSHLTRLNNFLARGSTVSFEPTKDDDPEDGEEDGKDEDDGLAPIPDANAEDRIPVAWKTTDRVLDVTYRHPRKEGETIGYEKFVERGDWPEEVEEQLEMVEMCKIKWCDLAYRECTSSSFPSFFLRSER
jgi:chromodomain-helicase-DNA-binding protein 4